MYFLGLKRAFFRRGKFLANSISMLVCLGRSSRRRAVISRNRLEPFRVPLALGHLFISPSFETESKSPGARVERKGFLNREFFASIFRRRIDDSIRNINLRRNFSNRDLNRIDLMNLKKFSLNLVKLFFFVSREKKKKFLSSNSNLRTNPTIFPFELKNRRFDLLILTKS